MLTLTGIEVYGSIIARARAMLAQKAAMLGGSGVTVRERYAGFERPLAFDVRRASADIASM